MKKIRLTQGQVAIVDDEDFERLAQFKWYALKHPKGYTARRNVRLPNGKQTTIKMHRFIMDAPPRMDVDHINGNSLDNRRQNLRLATRQQNCFNSDKSGMNKSSRYKGVSILRRLNKWQAAIVINGRKRYLGLYESEVVAAEIYDRAAVYYHGEFAKLNFPDRLGDYLHENAATVQKLWPKQKAIMLQSTGEVANGVHAN